MSLLTKNLTQAVDRQAVDRQAVDRAKTSTTTTTSSSEESSNERRKSPAGYKRDLESERFTFTVFSQFLFSFYFLNKAHLLLTLIDKIAKIMTA